MMWLGAIVAIGVLIVVHEAGHYFVARWCKMRVDRFSVGFGPPIWSTRRGDTTFQIAPIPFGGYVQIRGMLVSEEVAEDDPHSYPNKPAWQRFVTIFAGPATNYLFAIVLALGLYTCAGVPSGTSWYKVYSFADDSAAVGQLEVGDRIVAVEGQDIFLTRDGKAHTIEHEGKKVHALKALVQRGGGEPVQMTVLRDGELVETTVTPRREEQKNPDTGEVEEVWLLGIHFTDERERVNVGIIETTGHALWYPVAQTGEIISVLKRIITGEEKGELTGPVGIASYIKQSIEAGWIMLIQLLMMLNVYLGLFNLFPLPALDGGRLVFLGYEMTTRRRANPKIEAAVHMVGIMALLLIMVLVTFKDIRNLF